jgi:hypothetical protein
MTINSRIPVRRFAMAGIGSGKSHGLHGPIKYLFPLPT